MQGHVGGVVITRVKVSNFALQLLRKITSGDVVGEKNTVCVRLLPGTLELHDMAVSVLERAKGHNNSLYR